MRPPMKAEDGNWKNIKLAARFLKPYKWYVVCVLLIILTWQMASLAERYLFKDLIDEGTLYAAGTLGKSAFISIALVIAFVFVIVICIRALAQAMREHFMNRLEVTVVADVKKRYFNHLILLSLSFHTTHKTGSMISKITRGSKSIEKLIDILFYNIAPTIFQFVVVTISLFYFDPLSALIIFIIAITFLGFSIYMEHVRFGARVDANDVEDLEKGNVSDVLTNIESVKYYAKEEVVGAKFRGLSERTRAAFLRSYDYVRFQVAGQNFIIGFGALFIIYFPMQKFISGQLTLGTLVFIYTIYIGFAGSLYSFADGMKGFTQAIADFESLAKYERFTNDIIDKPHAKPMYVRRGRIRFNHVHFMYNTRKILDDLDLEIKPNEKVALVGPSGAGKSTVVKLLFRMYDVQEGQISIDGINITDVTQNSLRSEISIVPQECVLFDDTIYNNILFSRPDATRAEVLQAMKFAQLDKIIALFPQKEETIVGERGVKLSGGEKQRVSIARAILANKKILVLDEATSSLDSETEHEIQRDLHELMKGRTSIIIAHRLSTIMSADKIVVIENGKVTQLGTHKQLIKQKGRYKKLWGLQKGGYIK
jgi:ATP-binding cassette, subfamily B, heavy metal transporter